VKATRVLLTVVLAIVVQMALARYAVGGRWVFDLVLVGVVYAGVYWGPVAGMCAGTLGGLMQDALSGDVIGVGGFAKTAAGFAAGLAGGQLVVGGTMTRVATVAVASVGHRLIIIGLVAAVDQDWRGVPWSPLLMETLLNATAGFVSFQVTEMLPGALRQSRERRRPSLSRRRW
jgi:rod shape-determining protein MreD